MTDTSKEAVEIMSRTMSETPDLPRHVEVTLYQLISLSNWCDMAWSGQVETCAREFSRNVAGAMINIRNSLPAEILSEWEATIERIQENHRDTNGREHPAFDGIDVSATLRALSAERDDIQAKLDEAVGALEGIAKPKAGPDFDWSEEEVLRWRSRWYHNHEDTARATLAKIKAEKE